MLATSSVSVVNVNDGQDGQPGATGAQGVSVINVIPEYRLSTDMLELIPSDQNATGDYVWSETKPSIPSQTTDPNTGVTTNYYLWTRNRNVLSAGSPVYSDPVCDVVISQIALNVDSLNGQITSKVDVSNFETYIGSSGTITTMSGNVSSLLQDMTGIKTDVLDITTTTNQTTGEVTYSSSTLTTIEQKADQIALMASATTDAQTHVTTVTLTPEMVTAVTNQFVVKDPQGSATIISGGKIQADSITAGMIAANAITASELSANAVTADKINAGAITTAKLDAAAVTANKISTGAITTDKIEANAITTAKLATDAIKSTNYVAPVVGTEPYSFRGSFLNLSNGNFITPYFVIDNTTGNAYFKGSITSQVGEIGGWLLSDSKLYSGVTINNVEYQTFLQKYMVTIPVTVSNSYVTSEFTLDDNYVITPTRDGSGTFSFTYNLTNYPTSTIYIWDEYSSSKNTNIDVSYTYDGDEWYLASDSFIASSDHIGARELSIQSLGLTTGDLTIHIHFANMAISDGTYTEKIVIKDTSGNEYLLGDSSVVGTTGLESPVIGFKQNNQGTISYPFYVTRNGELHAGNAYLTGGEIAGFKIVSGDSAGTGQTSANNGHVYPTGLYVHTSATDGGVAYEYETGIRGDATSSTNAAFYVRRITSGGAWTTNLDDLMFYVRQNGFLYAKDANITGTITAKQFTAQYNGSSSNVLAELTATYLGVSNSSYSTLVGANGVTVNVLSSGSGSVYTRFARITSNLGFETYNNDAWGSFYGNSVDVGYDGVRQGRFTASAAGNIGLWDVDNQEWIIQSNSSYNVNIPHPLTANSLQVGSTTKTVINSGSIDVYNATSTRTGRLVSSASGNIGVYDVENDKYVIYMNIVDNELQTHIPCMVFCVGRGDTTQRVPTLSSNTTNQGVSWFGGTATTTLSIRAQWNAASWATKTVAVSSSDIRLKKDIKDSTVDALDVINRVKVREFTWKDDGVRQKIGVVVDELEELDPLLSVGGGEDEDGNPIYKSVNNLLMISYLTKAVQQLNEKIEILENKIEILKEKKDEKGFNKLRN